MNPPALFEDEIVQITEFKRHAKDYAERARQSPITIAQGSVADLTLMSRELAATSWARQRHLAQVSDLLFHRVFDGELHELGWTEAFDGDEMKQFVEEYAGAVHDAIRTGTDSAWQKVDEVFEDWQATAESLGNEELMTELRSYRRQRKQRS